MLVLYCHLVICGTLIVTILVSELSTARAGGEAGVQDGEVRTSLEDLVWIGLVVVVVMVVVVVVG